MLPSDIRSIPVPINVIMGRGSEIKGYINLPRGRRFSDSINEKLKEESFVLTEADDGTSFRQMLVIHTKNVEYIKLPYEEVD